MRDMNPRSDRSIRNIPVSNNHRRPPAQQAPRRYYEDNEEDEQDMPPPRRPRLPRRRHTHLWGWFAGAIVICAAFGFLLSTVFEKATITITPKAESIPTPATIVAQPNAPAGSLSYQTITATQTATTTVTAGGTQHVSRAATGIVTIYNSYSSSPQALVANTRLSSQDGKIYRIKDSVIVPGTTKKSDGTLAPGSVTVSIFADKPGADYNQTESIALNIVGFKGTPRYAKFVAQTQGPITNGFIGEEPAVSPDDMSTAQSDLKRQLDASIRSVATSQVPEGFIEVDGSLKVSYTDIVQSQGSGNSINLSQGATANLIIVRTSDLAANMAKSLPDYKNEPVAFSRDTLVGLSLTDPDSSLTGPISLTITGTSTLVWQFDQQAFKQELLGKNKREFQSVVKSFEPAIHDASATIRPFWKATFPDDPKKLTIIVTK